MRVLLSLAASVALAFVSTPAAALDSRVTTQPHVHPPFYMDSRTKGPGHDQRVHVHGGYPVGYGYAGYGYGDYSDFDGNRSFDPDTWNDWWHERPERAYPRWLSRNQDCARRWYSGDVLTC